MKLENRQLRRGFTLIEILIVIAIVAALASLVIANFGNASEDAKKTAFYLNGKQFAKAAIRYHLDYGEYPEDTPAGDIPANFDDYIQAEKWLVATPIGGLWDCMLNDDGITSAVGVDFNAGGGPPHDDAYMQEIDAAIDDGDLATGSFQRLAAGRYYFIVAK